MEAMLEEWDAKETSEHYDDGDASSDSEGGDEEDDGDAEARLAALKRSMATAGGDSDESESAVSAAASEESESEEEEAVEEEISEEEVEEEVEVSEEEESEDEAEEDVEEEEEEEAAAPVEDDDDGEVIDDGDITDTLKKKPKKKKEKVKVKKLSEEIDPNDAEAVEMAKLLGDWGVDDDDDADDDDDDDDDEESDASEREVVLDDGVIDHIVLAAPDLDEAMSNFEKMTGIAPKVAGTINGLGIKCARISFNDSSYLEIIAPDPKGPGPIGNLIKSRGIKELTPFHFAIRSSKAEDLKTEVKQFGYVPDHITMFGGTKDGVPKKWEVRCRRHGATAIISCLIIIYSITLCVLLLVNSKLFNRCFSSTATSSEVSAPSLSTGPTRTTPVRYVTFHQWFTWTRYTTLFTPHTFLACREYIPDAPRGGQAQKV